MFLCRWATKGIYFVILFRWSVSRMSPPFTEYLSCWKNRVLWTTFASVWTCLWRWDPEDCSQNGKRWLTGITMFHCCRDMIPNSEWFLFKHKTMVWGKSIFFRSDRLLEHVSIALVGKYTKLADAYTSVIKALEHSALAINHKLEVKVWRKRFKHLFLIRMWTWHEGLISPVFLQYVDSEDLEPATLAAEPVKYHEAWQKLCSSQWVHNRRECRKGISPTSTNLLVAV